MANDMGKCLQYNERKIQSLKLYMQYDPNFIKFVCAILGQKKGMK